MSRTFDARLDDAALHRCVLDFTRVKSAEPYARNGSHLRTRVLACQVKNCRERHTYVLGEAASPADVLLALDEIGLLTGDAHAAAKHVRWEREIAGKPVKRRRKRRAA